MKTLVAVVCFMLLLVSSVKAESLTAMSGTSFSYMTGYMTENIKYDKVDDPKMEPKYLLVLRNWDGEREPIPCNCGNCAMYCSKPTGNGWWKYNYQTYDSLDKVLNRLSSDELNAITDNEFVALYDLSKSTKVNLKHELVEHTVTPKTPEPYHWKEVIWSVE